MDGLEEGGSCSRTVGGPPGASRVRQGLALGWALCCLGGVALVFWYQDWRYALPTPVPVDHRPVLPGESVGFPAPLAAALGPDAGRPRVLHFFNPDCPCSRFNLDHLRELVRDHSDRVDFALVVQLGPGRSEYRAPEGLPVPVVIDAGGVLADHYGVYATPTAAVVAADGTLAYVGNYTSARYCVDPAEQYVRRALEALLDERPPPGGLGPPAPFGCALPSDPARDQEPRP